MKRIFAVFFLTFIFFASVNVGIVRSKRPDNPGSSVDNPSSERSQRPVGENGEKQRGKSSFAHIKSKNNKLQVAFESEEEVEATEEGEIEDEFEVENGKNGFKIRARENASLVIRNQLAAQTNFPLKVNLDTNELIVTTPKGGKTVTVLPDAAVFNMLAANVLDQLGGKGGLQWMADQTAPTSTPSATPTSTSSATITESSSSTSTPSGEVTESPQESPVETEPLVLDEQSPIELVLDEDGNLVYEIDGIKVERFLGIFKVDIDRIVVVSAETGELVEVKQNLANKILDLLSVD